MEHESRLFPVLLTAAGRPDPGAACRELCERAQRGDRDAYEALLRPRLPGWYRTAFGILRHEADARDAIQDSCIQAWRGLPALRDTDRFDAWFGRILVNSCRALLRTRRRVHIREVDLDTTSGGVDRADPRGSVADHVADSDAIQRAFVRLRPDERTILALHHADQRPLDEIAALLGAPVGTVKWRLFSARKALTRALERER